METPIQMVARLLTALDELIEQEKMCLHGGYYERAVQIRERSAPIVDQLVKLAYAPGVDAFRPRVAAVVGRSARHAAFLQEKIEELGAEIRRINHARFRAAQVAPAYAPDSGGLAPRFQAAG